MTGAGRGHGRPRAEVVTGEPERKALRHLTRAPRCHQHPAPQSFSLAPLLDSKVGKGAGKLQVGEEGGEEAQPEALFIPESQHRARGLFPPGESGCFKVPVFPPLEVLRPPVWPEPRPSGRSFP